MESSNDASKSRRELVSMHCASPHYIMQINVKALNLNPKVMCTSKSKKLELSFL